MHKYFFILIGRSGCGKGTQANLLKDYLRNKNIDNILHITTGATFRSLIAGDSYTSLLAKEVINDGGLLPGFMATWNWTNRFVSELRTDDTVMLDGAPRSLTEAYTLQEAIEFYKFKKVFVININVTSKWAKERLASRGRDDDNSEEERDKKMSWYDNSVLPVIDWYKNEAKNNYYEVNGEQSIEEVHKAIIASIENEI